MNSDNNIDINITFDENIEIIIEKEEPEQDNPSQTIIDNNLENFPSPFPEETDSVLIKINLIKSNTENCKNIVINKNINNRELYYLVYRKFNLLDISSIEKIHYNNILVPFISEEKIADQFISSSELIVYINEDFNSNNSINFISNHSDYHDNISDFLYQIRNHISNNINFESRMDIQKLTQEELDSIKEEKINNISEEEKCVICYSNFKKGEIIKVLKCKHIFHKKCITPWLLDYSNKCPFCKSKSI